MARAKGMTREQKWSVVLLSFGTFLEYFDLMLYAHMSILLNNMFFPQANPLTKQLLTATTFCLTYFLRPVAGVVVGKIGDTFGRKFTIMITTFIMATACLIMAITPEYKDVGITATVMIIIARMLQGFSSLGELMGAQIYITEMLKVPLRCAMSGVIVSGAKLGSLFALVVAFTVLSTGFSWRWAFGFGAFIAVIGLMARTKLRETPEFADYKRRIFDKREKNKQDIGKIHSIYSEKIDIKTVLAFAFTELHSPICFCITYLYMNTFMTKSLGMKPEQAITHNIKIALVNVLLTLSVAYLVKKIHPIKVAIITVSFFIIFIAFIPCWLNSIAGTGYNTTNLFFIFCMQFIVSSFGVSTWGTLDAIQYKYLPIGKRFTLVGTTFGISNPLGFAIASLGLIPLNHYFGHYGLLFIFTPTVVGYLWSLYYFRKLEIERGLYFDYPCEPKPVYEDTASDEKAYSYVLGPDYDAFKGEGERSKQFLNKMRELNKDAKRKVNIKLVEKAIVFAKRWHGTQVRKTGEPFYHHPISVADIISNYYFKTDVLVACLLHDTIEDDKTKQCTVELIEKEFNKRIAQLVEGVTKNKVVDGEDKILALKETLDDLSQKKEFEALLIKITDRTHNMQTADGWSPEKRRKKAIETTRDMLPLVAPVAEKLNIEEGIELEEKLFKPTNKALNKDE